MPALPPTRYLPAASDISRQELLQKTTSFCDALKHENESCSTKFAGQFVLFSAECLGISNEQRLERLDICPQTFALSAMPCSKTTAKYYIPFRRTAYEQLQCPPSDNLLESGTLIDFAAIFHDPQSSRIREQDAALRLRSSNVYLKPQHCYICETHARRSKESSQRKAGQRMFLQPQRSNHCAACGFVEALASYNAEVV